MTMMTTTATTLGPAFPSVASVGSWLGGGVPQQQQQQQTIASRHSRISRPVDWAGNGYKKIEIWSRASSVFQAQASRTIVRARGVDLDEWNTSLKASRLDCLEKHSLEALKNTIESFQKPTFPCALIAGDVVILDLLHKLGAFKDDKVKVVFIDTLHLFPETYEFLAKMEEKYGFKAHSFMAAGMANRDEFVEKFGSDLFITDIDKYDRVCKVEPFDRALSSLKVDAMINGRRRDHGAERAHLQIFDAGKYAKVQPLAFWEFRDCWDYIEKNHLAYHPLHDDGYPSIGDMQSTLPVPKDQWFEYGGERSGRFQGLTNKDGSLKTECGIHSPVSR